MTKVVGKYTDPPRPGVFSGGFITIEGVKFTPREIDVIAYLCNGRTGAKVIAAALSVAPKTIETHIRNIFAKIGNRCRDGIVGFIEKSDKDIFIKKHYENLQNYAIFRQILSRVRGTISKQQQQRGMIVYGSDCEDLKTIALKLEDFLGKVGLKGFSEGQNLPPDFTELIKKPLAEGVDKILYLISDEGLLRLQTSVGDASKKKSLSQKASDRVFVLQNRQETTPIPAEIKEVGYVELEEGKIGYPALVNLLKHLLPAINWEIIESTLKWQGDIHKSFSRGYPFEKSTEFLSKQGSQALVKVSKKRKRNIFIFSVLVASLILLLAMFRSLELSHKPAHLPSSSLRSDLKIPPEISFLNRPELLKQIEEKLKGEEGIQTVALVGIVGMGGVGKTTLARHFGSLHQASVVWEINAETPTTLMASFKDLAYELARTDEQKEQLKFIENIGDAEEKEKHLLSFVKQHLKEHSHWLLIYDNVENYVPIKPYLPTDPKIWGAGKVVITTRDANMKHSHYMQAGVIHINELTEQESLALFSKILYKKEPSHLSPLQREEALKFLKDIPPFPLDVSVAAYYIKGNNLTYQQYLERISGFNQNFENSQKMLLKEASDYTKTRYGIITSSVAKMIETNKEFEELLLFIGLLDSQNIPRTLLEFYKNPSLVDTFIHELKKYSLITAESIPSSHQLHAFSIHRSTQEIILEYLRKKLELEKNPKLIEKISIIFGNYLNDLMEKEDFSELELFTSHAERFLSHPRLIPNNASLLIKGYLGIIFHHLREDLKAKKFLEESLKNLSSDEVRGSAHVCQTLIYLGSSNMQQGSHEKAREFVDKALLLHKNYLSGEQVEVARSLAFIGDVYLNIGEYNKAKIAIEKSIGIYEKCYNTQAGFARSLAYLGIVYIYLGEYEKAKKILEQSLLIFKRHFPKTSKSFVWVFIYLGNAYGGLGDYEKAKIVLEEGVKVYKENFLEMHSDRAWAMLFLTDSYINLAGYNQAEEIAKKNFEIHEKLYGRNNIRTAEALLRLGNVYRGLKEYQKAQDILKETLRIYEKTFGKRHLETARVLRDLGLVYLEEGQLETAEGPLLKALGIFQNNKHPDSYTCLESLGDLYLKKYTQDHDKSQERQNFKKQAINYYEQALEIIKTYFPENSPHAARIKSKTLSVTASP